MKDWAAVSARRMFGGYGLHRDGSMFALIIEDGLFFKTDPENLARLERTGSRPFVYQSQGRAV
jgi:DNA transformation protein